MQKTNVMRMLDKAKIYDIKNSVLNFEKRTSMKHPILLPEMKTSPAVFAVGDTYQIITPVKSDLLFSVKVGAKEYLDHSNGILRSKVRIHKITVPMHELDGAGDGRVEELVVIVLFQLRNHLI